MTTAQQRFQRRLLRAVQDDSRNGVDALLLSFIAQGLKRVGMRRPQEQGSICIYHPDSERLVFKLTTDTDGNYLPFLAELPMDKQPLANASISGAAFLTRSTTIGPTRWLGAQQEAGYHKRVLAVPLFVCQNCVGVLTAVTPYEKKPLQNDQIADYEFISALCGVILGQRTSARLALRATAPWDRRVAAEQHGNPLLGHLMAAIQSVSASSSESRDAVADSIADALLDGVFYDRASRLLSFIDAAQGSVFAGGESQGVLPLLDALGALLRRDIV